MKKSQIVFAIGTFLVTGFLLLLNSCQKDNQGLTDSEDETAVTDMLKMSTTAEAISACDDKDSSKRPKHRHLEISEIDPSTLPAVISTYLAANYAGSSITRAGTDSLGRFFILITKSDSSRVGLLFDASGNFVKEILRRRHGDRGSNIAISALPSSITGYISTNYPSATIHKALQESDGEYKVLIVQSDGTFLGLAFDASGNFVSTLSAKDKHGKKRRRH